MEKLFKKNQKQKTTQIKPHSKIPLITLIKIMLIMVGTALNIGKESIKKGGTLIMYNLKTVEIALTVNTNKAKMTKNNNILRDLIIIHQLSQEMYKEDLIKKHNLNYYNKPSEIQV